MFNIMEAAYIGLLATAIFTSILISIGAFADTIVTLRKEYFRRKTAREKYSVDSSELGILENEFYHPEVTKGEILLQLLKYGIPGVNLVVLIIGARKWLWKEFKLWLNSPVFPW